MRKTLKNKSPVIFSLAAIAGVIGVGYTSIRATMKAVKILETAKDENDSEIELSKIEKVELLAPSYILPLVFTLFTVSCIIGAHICNQKQQAAIISAYMALDKTYRQYACKVKDAYGEEADINIKKEVIVNQTDRNIAIPESEHCLFYDEYSTAYFESTVDNVLKAEKAFNDAIRRFGSANIRYFYELVNTKNLYFAEIFFDHEIDIEIRFEHEIAFINDDLECRIVRMTNIPYA